jgi:hypothetical protein
MMPIIDMILQKLFISFFHYTKISKIINTFLEKNNDCKFATVICAYYSTTAITSISTFTSFGNLATSTAERAGL